MSDSTRLYQTVVFDLDGTLADSLADLAAATNHALTELGRPTHPLPRFRSLVGQGADFLITHALGPDHQDLHGQAMSLFRAHYLAHMGEQTRVYPGVEDLLLALKERGIKLGVLTNKPHDATVQFMAEHFQSHTFDAVLGIKPGMSPKPDPTGAHELLAALNTPAEQAIYLGDTDVDMHTGRATGMFTVGCTWGFRPDELADTGAQAIIDRPADLLRLVDG